MESFRGEIYDWGSVYVRILPYPHPNPTVQPTQPASCEDKPEYFRGISSWEVGRWVGGSTASEARLKRISLSFQLLAIEGRTVCHVVCSPDLCLH